MYLSFVTATLAALAAVSPVVHPAAMQQNPPPDYVPGYTPDSALPGITGQASAPITLTVKKQSPDIEPENVVEPDTFPFTVTGKDMDTWKRDSDNTLAQFADPLLACYKAGEQWATSTGPNFRGTSTDNVGTWDLAVKGIVYVDRPTLNGPHSHPAQVYINSYIIANAAGRTNSLLNDDPLTVQQTITCPAYTTP